MDAKKNLNVVLDKIQCLAKENKTPIVVFDLDDTLLSTRERTLKIIREFSDENGEKFPSLQEAVSSMEPSDIRYGVEPTLTNVGLRNPKLKPALQNFWWDRFFTDDYISQDVPILGAVEFVQSCFDEGAVIYYCTGRHFRNAAITEGGSPSPGMEAGTVQALLTHGFPLMSGRTILHLKSSFGQADSDYKHQEALPRICQLNGTVVATFENEPENANIFLEAFPSAHHFWLQTLHKPNADKPHSDLLRLESYNIS